MGPENLSHSVRTPLLTPTRKHLPQSTQTITGMHFDSNLYQNVTQHSQRNGMPFTQDQSLSQYN